MALASAPRLMGEGASSAVTAQRPQYHKGDAREMGLGKAAGLLGRSFPARQAPHLPGLSTLARLHLHQASAQSASFLFVCCCLGVGFVEFVEVSLFRCVSHSSISPLGDLCNRRKSMLHGSVLPVVTCLGDVFSPFKTCSHRCKFYSHVLRNTQIVLWCFHCLSPDLP